MRHIAREREDREMGREIYMRRERESEGERERDGAV